MPQESTLLKVHAVMSDFTLADVPSDDALRDCNRNKIFQPAGDSYEDLPSSPDLVSAVS